jgi:transposase-like protein
LAERGLDVSHETVRRWVTKFGVLYARVLRRRRPWPSGRWHQDEVFVSIGGKRMYLWRAVNAEGEVLNIGSRGAERYRVSLRKIQTETLPEISLP